MTKNAAPSRESPGRTPKLSPLSSRLATPTRASPQTLFELALDWWNRGERFDIGRMANALGVSRATVFRWVGSRELLYGEVISSQFDLALQLAKQGAKGEGAAQVADVSRRLMEAIVASEPLRRFVQQDPEYAMRILMSKSSTVEERSAKSVQATLEEQVAEGRIRPAMPLDALAYLIVRIGESFLYRDALNGARPDIESAVTAIAILVSTESLPAGLRKRRAAVKDAPRPAV